MRILQVSHNYHIAGGSDSVFFETSRLLQDAGHQVIPFCMASDENLASDWQAFFPSGADSAHPTWRDAGRYFFNRDAVAKLKALLKTAGPFDVAHLHIYHGKQTPAILPVLRQARIPVVQSLHEYKLACPVYTLQRHGQNCELCVTGSAFNCVRHRCKDRSYLKSAVMVTEKATSRYLGDVRFVDRFICVSDFQKTIMKKAGLPERKLTTLHNFVDVNRFAETHSDDGYLLYFGRIEKLKGLGTLVEAVKRTGQRLVIAGRGSWECELARNIDGTDHITYLGFRAGSALQDLLQQCTAVVVPSEWYENCPMSLLEAKAAGKPVIAARTGGIPELVRDRVDGLLFNAGCTDDLEAALRVLEKADLKKMSAAARSDAAQRFSQEAHLSKLVEVYQCAAEVRNSAAHCNIA